MIKDINLIPKDTMYCYTLMESDTHNKPIFKPCPYWSLKGEYNGYCSYLEQDDESIGNGLLFDQCKECSISMGILD
jgi:hypothetical protein